jgi:hypothetical protein
LLRSLYPLCLVLLVSQFAVEDGQLQFVVTQVDGFAKVLQFMESTIDFCKVTVATAFNLSSFKLYVLTYHQQFCVHQQDGLMLISILATRVSI